MTYLFQVILEKSGVEHSKTVSVKASDKYAAMATAQLKNPGWVAVDCH